MSIKDNLEIIKIILEISNLLNPLIKLACTKIEKYFRERKKTLVKQIKLISMEDISCIGTLNTLISI